MAAGDTGEGVDQSEEKVAGEAVALVGAVDQVKRSCAG